MTQSNLLRVVLMKQNWVRDKTAYLKYFRENWNNRKRTV